MVTTSVHSHRFLSTERGFTLIELVLVLVISGILITVAARNMTGIAESGRQEQTLQAMKSLEFAICGNPELQNNGTRSDFGYVGDVGALPASLADLTTNPGGYVTWKGPYIRGSFQQAAADYGKDAWGVSFVYSGTTSLASVGSGDTIVHAFSNTTSELLNDKVSGVVSDSRGFPPGETFSDSINIQIDFPSGSGAMASRTIHPDPSGYFQFDSIPVGMRDLTVSYGPTRDSLRAYVTVLPGSTTYGRYRFATSLWGSAAMSAVAGSDTVSGSPPCTDANFWIANNSGAVHTLSTITVSWSSPSAYYGQVYIAGNLVFDKAGSPRGVSGATYTLSAPQTISDGELFNVQIRDFRSNNSSGGGSGVAMGNSTITVTFSDGTSFTEVMPSCP